MRVGSSISRPGCVMKRPWVVLIAIAVTVLVAAVQAGCDGDSGPFTGAGQPPENPALEVSEGATGDVDCDGDLDAVDALAVSQYADGLRPGSEQCPPPPGSLYLPAADVDGDGDVNANDAEMVVQCITDVPPGNTLPFCAAQP